MSCRNISMPVGSDGPPLASLLLSLLGSCGDGAGAEEGTGGGEEATEGAGAGAGAGATGASGAAAGAESSGFDLAAAILAAASDVAASASSVFEFAACAAAMSAIVFCGLLFVAAAAIKAFCMADGGSFSLETSFDGLAACKLSLFPDAAAKRAFNNSGLLELPSVLSMAFCAGRRRGLNGLEAAAINALAVSASSPMHV
mmetsp:Transcript_93771/g.264826  ORF Transcript_93771/g.264826 Transcript_93771/m.264826 type:complete len:200 (-) Transcript_93771:391-990(-)